MRMNSKSSISILAKAISSRKGLTQAEAERFIAKMFEVANQGLQDDKQLKMKWLGTFKVTAVKDRESVDVNTGERILIEGRDKINFTPDNILKEIINKPFAQFETVVVNDGVDFSDIDEKFSHVSDGDELKENSASVETSTKEASSQTQLQQVSSEQASSEQGLSEHASSEQVLSEQAHITVASESQSSLKPEVEEHQIAIHPAVDSVHVFGGAENTEQVSDSVELIEDTPVSTVHKLPEKEEIASNQVIAPEKVEDTVKPIESEDETENLPKDEMAHQKEDEDESVNPKKSEDKPTKAINEKETGDESTVEKHSVSQSEKKAEVVDDVDDEEDFSGSKHHFVIPKYVVIVACFLFVLLAGGMAWLAFSYGKMAAQQDHLMSQINDFKKKEAHSAATKQASAVASNDNTQDELSQKAKEDSIRMAKASEAVKMAENAEKQKTDQEVKAEKKEETSAKQDASPKKQDTETSRFDNDVRVRTGAYRITGIAQTITVKPGQTLASISKLYLGPGMECYVEAVNGNMTEAKAGQKIKIPKLELKKRK